MARAKRASMREGPLADLFRSTRGEDAQDDGPAETPGPIEADAAEGGQATEGFAEVYVVSA